MGASRAEGKRDMTDLLSIDQQKGECAVVDDATGPAIPVARIEPTTMLAVIAKAATDPQVDIAKMEALLRMQRDLEIDQARAEFNRAYTRLTGKMPRVKKNGRIELITREGVYKGTLPFAKWEDIDRVVRPLLAEDGFGLTFTSQLRTADGGGLIIHGTLLHRDGHSISAEIPLPLDTGAGRNNLQAYGSTLSYGKRYVAEMLLNIVREGDDDDGKAAGDGDLITEAQVHDLVAAIYPAGVTQEQFCARWQIDTLADLPLRHFAEALNGLRARAKAREQAKGKQR